MVAGLTSTTKRDDRADTCNLLPARGSVWTLVSMAVSHHRSGRQASALADARRQQAKEAPADEGCAYRRMPQLGAVNLCNGSLGVSVQTVGATRYIHRAHPR